MLSIDQCKKMDSSLKNLSDEDITKIRDSYYALVRSAFTIQNINDSKSPRLKCDKNQ